MDLKRSSIFIELNFLLRFNHLLINCKIKLCFSGVVYTSAEVYQHVVSAYLRFIRWKSISDCKHRLGVTTNRYIDWINMLE